jgi:hypothetical protein
MMKASAYLSYGRLLTGECRSAWAGEHACRAQPTPRKITKALEGDIFQYFVICPYSKSIDFGCDLYINNTPQALGLGEVVLHA